MAANLTIAEALASEIPSTAPAGKQIMFID